MSLVIKNITFGYDKKKTILADISFDVPKGQTVSILGVSGSGKSTLLRIISGLLKSNSKNQFSGEAIFNGIPIHQLKNVGELSFMFQDPTLMPNLSVRKNIELPLRILNRLSKSKVDEIIQLVGLKDYQEKLPKNLSGGMKTRTALARSFITSPKLLFLDEPFSGLDLAWRTKIHSELLILQKTSDTTVVLITHDVDEAVELSQRVLILGRKGKIIADFGTDAQLNRTIAAKAKNLIIADHSAEN